MRIISFIKDSSFQTWLVVMWNPAPVMKPPMNGVDMNDAITPMWNVPINTWMIPANRETAQATPTWIVELSSCFYLQIKCGFHLPEHNFHNCVNNGHLRHYYNWLRLSWFTFMLMIWSLDGQTSAFLKLSVSSAYLSVSLSTTATKCRGGG